MNVVEARRWAASDRGAELAFRIALAVSAVVFIVVGRHQWFIRDDFAFIITRNVIREDHGWDEWLFVAQDGHWMTPPILVYRLVEVLFGIDSYWPFLLPTLAAHVGIVLLVRVICRRVGVSAWTTTLICSVLLVFGSGWENIVFGIQITYNLSLLAFLAHVVLADHDGPPDWRDAVGAVIGVVGMSSSGFGPFFLFGIALLLVLRRRWIPLAIATVPQALAFAWWYLQWYDDPIADELGGPRTRVPEYAVRGISATFEGLVGIAALTGLALVAAIAVVIWRGSPGRNRIVLVTLWATAIVMFLGVGWTRIGFGLDSASVSRYRYMGAMLLAPALALAIDTLVRWTPAAVATARAVLGVSVVLNAGWLHNFGSDWASRAQRARDLYEVTAGADLGVQADPERTPEPFNPDVTVRWIPYLVDEGAVVPRPPADDAELQRVRAALGLP
jgi:hypothetical protein